MKKIAEKDIREAIFKELKWVSDAEEKCRRKSKVTKATYKDKIKEKIPKGLNSTLQAAFAKAFGIVFKHGVGIIEKSYNKEGIAENSDIQNYAIDRKGTREEIKKLKRAASKSDFLNMSITAVEGIGLGALGVGLPDIVIFIGMVLKGIYEVSLHYGYDYNNSSEKYFILKVIEAALSKNDEWERANRVVDRILTSQPAVGEDVLSDEIEATSELMATDMLVLKFIQGIPVIGMLGGIFNPVYYNKIMNYVKIKYYKRYLNEKLSSLDKGIGGDDEIKRF